MSAWEGSASQEAAEREAQQARAKAGIQEMDRLGRKDDAGKPRWDLLPWAAVADVVRVLDFGAQKYEPEGWRKVVGARARYFAAATRHVTAWWRGEKNDPESGLPHLAHAACCLLFLAELDA